MSSATPGDFEKEHSTQIVEQVIRPTGLLDPEVDGPVRWRARSTTCSRRSTPACAAGERVLVTTLTKKMAEDLTAYLENLGVQRAVYAPRHRHH